MLCILQENFVFDDALPDFEYIVLHPVSVIWNKRVHQNLPARQMKVKTHLL